MDNGGRLYIIINKTPLQTWWLHFSLSSVAIFQHLQGIVCLHFTTFTLLWAQYNDFYGIAQLLTQKILKQGCVTPRLKKSLQKFYCRDHELVDLYEISTSQMTMDISPCIYFFLSYITDTRLLPDWTIWKTWQVKGKLLTLRDHMDSHPGFWWVYMLLIFFNLFLFCLRTISCLPDVASVSGLSIIDFSFGFL
jgi:hypothetical protein